MSDERVKRSMLAALLMSLPAPFFSLGLIYVRRPVKAVVCSLIWLGVLFAQLIFHTFDSFSGMAISTGLVLLTWLYSILAAAWHARRGLTLKEAQRDMGWWLVLWIVITLPTGQLGDLPYKNYVLQTDAMAPAIGQGEQVWVHMRGANSLNVGDVAVSTEPAGAAHPLIRRVAGLPGDVLEYRDNTLLRNKREVMRTAQNPFPSGESVLTVPNNSFFLTADHGGDVGYLSPRSAIQGKALYIMRSKDWGRIGKSLTAQ